MQLFPGLKQLAAEVFTKTAGWVPFITDEGVTDNPYSLAHRRSIRRNYDVERAAIEVYERTIWAFKAIETITNHVGARQFRYRDRKTNKVIEDHPIYEVLNGGEANPLNTGPGLKKRIAGQLLLSERGVFAEPTRSRRGDIIRIDLLPPNRTKPIPDPGPDLLSHFELTIPNKGVRKIPRDKIIWIKNDHPLDPYRSSTPMNAVGLSVHMDDLGRLTNVSWMSNDGNARGIVAVKGEDISPETEQKLSKRFGVGPSDAGKVTVILSDGIEYIDLSAKPRDMQYEKLAQNAKIETLAGFGVPESQLGNASGRTFANAEAEGYIFWRITMLPLLNLIAIAFADRDHPEWEPYFDVEDVHELQLPHRAKLELALKEVAAGVRSVQSYAELAGIEIESTPETRALWFPGAGRTPFDQEPGANERVKLPSKEEPAALPAGGGAAQQDLDQTTGSSGTGSGRQDASNGGGQSQANDGSGSSDGGQGGGVTATVTSVGSASGGLTDDSGAKAAEVGTPRTLVSDVDEDAQAAHEAKIAAALIALTDRWVARTVARLQSPKARKGTRHWQPDPNLPEDFRVGTKVLDVYQAVDPDTWRTEADSTVTHLLQAAGDEAAIKTVQDLSAGEVEFKVDVSMLALASAVGAGVSLVATAVGLAAANAAAKTAERLAEMEADGASMDEMVAEVRRVPFVDWARKLAQTATASAVESGRHAAVTLLGKLGFVVTGEWRSKRDEKVRPTHRAADGQVQPIGRPFTVGGVQLRYPRDPLGPPQEVLNCRCKVRWSVRRRSSLTAEPAAKGIDPDLLALAMTVRDASLPVG